MIPSLNRDTKIIAVAGKGGVGKTSISAAFVRLLTETYPDKRILAIDADPAIYRIKYAEHHRQGSKWCIYPMYDFAHPIQDAIEGITHSMCSLEFENHRPLYNWVIENIFGTEFPKQREFARLNMTNTVMSKRYLRELVEMGIVLSVSRQIPAARAG